MTILLNKPYLKLIASVLALLAVSPSVMADEASLQKTLDIIWLIVAAALVFFMQAGFCFLETGLVRKKNSLNVAVKNITDMMVAIIIYGAVGYAFMFGSSSGGFIGTDGFFLNGVTDPYDLSFFVFQAMFAGTVATVVSGAVAERMQFGGYVIMALILAAFVYPVAGHWVWSGDGWLAQQGFIDFAGSTVVHSVGAWVALAGVMILGPRKGRFNEDGTVNDLTGHDLLLTTIGVFILWMGWFGFNGGSTLAADESIAPVVVNTVIAAAAGGVANLMLSSLTSTMIRIERILNGVLGGLVAITAGVGVVDTHGAIILGASGGMIAHYGYVFITDVLKLDDPVSAIPVHGFAGAWGTIALVLVMPDSALSMDRVDQLLVQFEGVIVIGIWSFISGLILFSALKFVGRLRVDEEHEDIGLNVAEHGARTAWLDTLNAMNTVMENRDLTTRIDIEVGSEAGEVANLFNKLMDSFAANIQQMKVNSDDVEQTAKNLTDFTEQMNQRLDMQNQQTSEVEQAVLEMKAQIERLSEHTSHIVKVSEDADTELGSSTQVIQFTSTAVNAMKEFVYKIESTLVELEGSASKVGVITQVISDIAEQTNLLALNAAIEAARAGDHGRGFAVVADEVRKLAQKTQDSVGDIKRLIGDLQSQSQTARELSEQGKNQTEQSTAAIEMTGMAFNAIVEAVAGVKEVNTILSTMVQEQIEATGRIHTSMSEINTLTDNAAHDVERLLNDGRKMSESSEKMNTAISEYKVIH
jgi:Amt family ammonium transporter